jgi:hypothetical protein
MWIGVGAEAQEPKPATLRGKVFSDSVFKPLVGVEVRIVELSKSASTDEKGAFRLDGIPPGAYQVQARKIGFAAYLARIQFGDGQNVEIPIVLPQVAPLDTVRIVGEARVPLSFVENRAIGFGRFVTRDELERQGNRRLAEILSNLPGLGVVFGRGAQGWVLSKRYAAPIRSMNMAHSVPGEPVYIPEPFERVQGMKAGCYAHVYLDNSLLNPRIPADPVDVNQFNSQQIEAIEYYSGPAQVPAMYAKLNSPCGVLVLHTRRSP